MAATSQQAGRKFVVCFLGPKGLRACLGFAMVGRGRPRKSSTTTEDGSSADLRFLPNTQDLERFKRSQKQESQRKTSRSGSVVSKIQSIRLGDYEIEPWFTAPYPEEYNQPVLYICEFCLKYMNNPVTHARHQVSGCLMCLLLLISVM